MSGGLGLDEFLKHNQGGGGKRAFMRDWKKDGELVFWFSTRAPIASVSWVHTFNSIVTRKVKDKKTGIENEFESLWFHRFVSPDPEVVHASQYFRNANDTLQVSPVMDPFLLLREWLRLKCQEPTDAPVFKWVNPDPDKPEVTVWRRGHLARLVDRNNRTWNHSLDTKLEYLLVGVDDNEPEKGCQIVRVAKGLGDAIKKELGNQTASDGEKGNPLAFPYAYRFTYDDKARSFNDTYGAHRYNKAKLTDEIKELITAPEFPDPTPDTRWRQGDKAKIRAAMEDAAQIDIPWNLIFSNEWKDEDPASFPFGDNEKKAKNTDKSTRRGDDEDFSDETGAASESDVRKAKEDARRDRGDAERSTKAGPQTRRRKKEPEPEPEPEVETLPCEECGYDMKVTDTVCAKCGQKYDVVIDDDPAPSKNVSSNDETASTKSNGKTGATSGKNDKCWSCGGPVVGNRCKDCGLDVTDDVPFGQ